MKDQGENSGVRPEFVRLPARGGDPICGLSRSWWYGAEKQGLIRLIRMRKQGNQRGRVLIPVQQAIALVRSMGEGAASVTVESARPKPDERSETIYTADQVCAMLQISKVTLWRLEQRGLLLPIPHLRHKRYSVAAGKKFAESKPE